MRCVRPLVYLQHPGEKPRLSSLSWLESQPDYVRQMDWIRVPCGYCIGCQADKAQLWTDRLMMEFPYLSDKSQACFLTLTYDDAHVPMSYTLSPWSGRMEYCYPLRFDEVSAFMKRLRSRLGVSLRFLASAEYGGRYHRPHYHIALLGFKPDDLRFRYMRNGYTYYNSEFVDSVWQRGFAVLSDLTPDSGAYVARYMTNKWLSANYFAYRDLCRQNDLDPLPAPGLRMSRRPGLGHAYLMDHKDQILRNDIIVQGQTKPAFRYAVSLLSDSEREQRKLSMPDFADRRYNTSLCESVYLAQLEDRMLRHTKKRHTGPTWK